MTTGPTNLADMAEATLAALVAQYQADGLVPPARRYVTVGMPVAECEALVVSFARLADGSADGERTRKANIAATHLANLHAWAFRCLSAVSGGEGVELLEAPPMAALTLDGRLMMTDAYVMRRGILRAAAAGTIGGRGMGVQVGVAEPMEPSGGIGGIRLSVFMDLF